MKLEKCQLSVGIKPVRISLENIQLLLLLLATPEGVSWLPGEYLASACIYNSKIMPCIVYKPDLSSSIAFAIVIFFSPLI